MNELGTYPLPKGWDWATIPELSGRAGVFIDGDWVESKDQDPNGDIRLIQLADVGDGIYRNKSNRFMSKAKADELHCTFLNEGDVLIARMPDPLGRACIFPGDFKPSVTVVDVAIVRSGNGEFNHRWLAHFVNAHPFRSRVSGLQAGSTRKRISRGNLATIPLPVPPLQEQRRIVAEIEKQFTRLDAGLAALWRAQSNLKRYRAAVLKAACEGRLVPTEAELARSQRSTKNPLSAYETGEALLARILAERCKNWQRRGQYKEPAAPDVANLPSPPEGWTWASIDQLASETMIGLDRGRTLQSDDPTSGVPYIKMSNITMDGRLVWDELAYVPADRGELERFAVKAGDILFNTRNSKELVGKVGIVRDAPDGAIYNNNLMRIRVPRGIDPEFLCMQMCSHEFRRRMELVKKATTNVAAVYQKDLLPLAIALPPLAEQTRIVAEVERRLSVVEELEGVVSVNLRRAARLRQSILQRAFTGNLVPQNPGDEPAEQMLERVRNQEHQVAKASPRTRGSKPPSKEREVSAMKDSQDPKFALETALSRKPEAITADDLFRAGEFERAQAYVFYDAIADSPEAITRLRAGHHAVEAKPPSRREYQKPRAPLRLHELWVKRFKNLEDYLVTFDPQHALDVLLGWNGTGKSNLFEVLIAIFRDLHKWQTKDKWTPQEGLEGYRIRYEIDGRLVEIKWDIHSRRPVAIVAEQHRSKVSEPEFQKCKREEIPLPHFVFGYYSGPSNRFADLFSEPKQDHYDRLLKEKSDDEATLARLLEQRCFFNAETHHAKYALLSFFYQDDPGTRGFLKKHLRIEDIESVLFVLKRPRWHRNNKPEDFWGADGLLRPVLERLRRHSIGHMVLPQSVDDGFQESTRDHFFLLLPDKQHLQALASEYADPTSFFVALESTDFSSIIHEVRIRVRINATASKQTVITFKEMSEGEQQLLMVLGLLRFTKMSQSLVLLDEPDTHLNPHWQLGYLRLLLEALVGTASDRKSPTRLSIEELEKRLTSQVLLSTHDPLAIAGLVKENIHLLKRRDKTEECLAAPPTEDPRGMGFTGILTSEMFGLKSDLDNETLGLLDQHAELAGKERLTTGEKKKLREMTDEVEHLGFKSTSSDPYYRSFLQALARRRNARDLMAKATWTKEDIKSLGKETDEILKEIEKEDGKK